MTTDDWDTSHDWSAMLGQLLGVDGSRKLRLWTVAICRADLDRRYPEAVHLREAQERGEVRCISEVDLWYASAGESIPRDLDNAERLAAFDRRQFVRYKPTSGGPGNLFHMPWWKTRLNTQYLREFLARIPDAGGVGHHEAAAILRDIFVNPFRPVVFDPRWRTEHTVGLAAKMYDDREFAAMPILADALEEAGCDSEPILTHCREPGVHVRGCWVVDLVLGKS